MHIDTGHNFGEVIDFRDARAAELGETLIVRSVEDSIKRGSVVLRRETDSRNAAQAVTLLEAIEEFGFDACIGGARRDEEKRARQGTHLLVPRRVRPMGSEGPAAGSLEPVQHPRASRREHARVPDLELDRAGRVATSSAKAWRCLRSTTRTSARWCGARAAGAGDAADAAAGRRTGRARLQVRFRTVGDISCTCPVASDAADTAAIIAETAVTDITERGATRMDDQTSEASMERRKKEGYF